MKPYDVLTDLGILPGDFGCAMLGVEAEDIPIDPADLYESPDLHDNGGVQIFKHVTLRYGITDPNVSMRHVQGLLENVMVPKPDELSVIGLSYFPGDGYEVITLSVDNPNNEWLYMANAQMQILPGINTFPNYVPHVTLAYVKAGWFAAHADKIETPRFIYTGDVVYSPPEVGATKT